MRLFAKATHPHVLIMFLSWIFSWEQLKIMAGQNVKYICSVSKPAFVDKENKRKRNRDVVTQRVVKIRFEFRNLNSSHFEFVVASEKYNPSPTYFV